MAKRIFIIILAVSIIIVFLPVSMKLLITKYPRIILLAPLEQINKLVTSIQLHKAEFQQLEEIATRLSIENARLQETLRTHQVQMQTENAENLGLIRANIIARDAETGIRFFTIDKCERDNIAVNMPIINAHGIVGKIIETNERLSTVETALSPGLKISALDLRSRVNGIIECEDIYTKQLASYSNLLFKYAFYESDIQVGDTIVTSGLGGIFPKGLNIGIVIKVKNEPTQFFQIVEIKPAVTFNTLSEVFILTSAISNINYTAPRYNRMKQLQNLKIEAPLEPRVR